MRIAELLQAIASWLESPNNEAILLAEYDEDCLKVVAESCVEAAHSLKIAADKVEAIEPLEASLITSENIEELAHLATALDSSDDEALKKQASVIDELLLTISANPQALANKKAADDDRIDQLKKKYENPRKEWEEDHKIADMKKAIEKSPMMKTYQPQVYGLSARTCINHPGSQLQRVADGGDYGKWRCSLGGELLDYENGFVLENGTKIPSGSVADQTKGVSNHQEALFDSRETRLGTNKP